MRLMIPGALLVVLVGVAAVLRYYQLAQEHPEAARAFQALLLLSIAVLAAFIAGLTVMLRRDR